MISIWQRAYIFDKKTSKNNVFWFLNSFVYIQANNKIWLIRNSVCDVLLDGGEGVRGLTKLKSFFTISEQDYCLILD